MPVFMRVGPGLPAAAGGLSVNSLRKLCHRNVTCILLRMIDRISHFAAF